MIEVTARLLRGPVYLSGELVECSITFSHLKSVSYNISQSSQDIFESLAWASAQIHCQCTTDSKVKIRDEKGKNLAYSETALAVSTDEEGQVENSTKPKILFCDLKLAPGQTKTYIYREKIPCDSPPSYRGQLVKYSYKLTIGTQRVNSPIKLLKVPIRVLPINVDGLGDFNILCNDTSEELSPANPFQEIHETDKETPFEIALQALQNITARRNPNFYMISNTWGKVGRFCIFKNAYRLGEDIIGTFDFSCATIRCVQVCVSLQCEEETTMANEAPTLNNNNNTLANNTIDAAHSNANTNKQVRTMTFSRQHEVCLGVTHAQLVLPIPLHVTPAFKTPLVTLKWRLHFEFVTSRSEKLEMDLTPLEGGGNIWRAPAELSIETMVWSLPIKLFSSPPIQVAQGLQSNTIHRLTIK